jgi:hypothetical protein
LRVSEPYTLFDSKQLHGKAPEFWDEDTNNTGATAHSSADARTRMTTAASGDGVLRQTFMRFDYQTGKSQQIFMTFANAATDTNVIKRVGMFKSSPTYGLNPINGIYFENDGTGAYLKIAKNSSVTESVAQASWNGDVFSGHDWDENQIMMIDFEWLGVGTVRVFFQRGNELVLAHTFEHAGDAGFSSVYMSTPNLPLCYYIYQGGVGAGTLDHICSSVTSEGGRQKTGDSHSLYNTAGVAGGSGQWEVLIALRHQSGFDDIAVTPDFISSVSTGTNKEHLLGLFLNPTYSAGGGFSYTALTNSNCEYFLGTGAEVLNTGQRCLFSVGATSNTGVAVPVDLLPRLGAAIDGTRDELVLACFGAGSAVTVYGTLNWGEL